MLRKASCALLMLSVLALAGCATRNVVPTKASRDFKLLAKCSAMVTVDDARDGFEEFNAVYRHPSFLDDYPDKKSLKDGIILLAAVHGKQKFGMDLVQAGRQYVMLESQMAVDVSQDIGYILALDFPQSERAQLAADYVESTIRTCKPLYAQAWVAAKK